MYKHGIWPGILLGDNRENGVVSAKGCDKGTGIPEAKLKNLFTAEEIERTRELKMKRAPDSD